MRFLPIVILAFILSILNSCATVKSENSIFWVSGYKTEAAAGAGKMKILKVHRGENLEIAKWENFYAPINGLEFKEGVLQKISVKETKLDPSQVPADASSIKYDLVKVLETQIDPISELNGDWTFLLMNVDNIKDNFRAPTLKIDLSEMRISGNGGCNSCFGSIVNLDPTKIKFGPVGMTKKMCFEPSVEEEFGAILSKIEMYRISGEELNFFDSSGTSLLTFRK